MSKSQYFALAALTLCAIQAQASLVMLGAQDFQGTGLGAVNTILTLQSPGSTSNESGSVGRAVGNPNDVITGNAMTGASQTQTRTAAELGLTTAAQLRVVFNALEPGASNSILLNNLQLNIFSAAGALLFNSGAFTAINFSDTFTGAGNSGFVFGLDAAQAAAAQSLAFGAGFGTNRIGLSANLSNATGGFETFFVANAPAQVPEPGSLVLAGIALLGMAASLRRRH